MIERDSQRHAELLQLLNAARAGDAHSKNEICLQVQGYLLALVQSEHPGGLLGKLNPSDIVQQSMTRMVVGLADFRGESLPEFYGWLRIILANEIRNTTRDWKRECRDFQREVSIQEAPSVESTGLVDRCQTPSELALANEKLARFYHALAQLPEDYQRVIQLRSLDELPFKDVGKVMGKSESAVTKLWYRAMVRFQEELDKLADSMGL